MNDGIKLLPEVFIDRITFQVLFATNLIYFSQKHFDFFTIILKEDLKKKRKFISLVYDFILD